jgi:hypothetical protein
MQLLEYFYDRNNELSNYHQRKFTILETNLETDLETNKLLIYGSPHSGKSSLVLDYLMNYESEEILYIDFLDPKFQFRDMMQEDIEGFIQANSIKCVVLDHYVHEYFEILPLVNKLIIISDRAYDYGEEFGYLELPLLDYEEFFSFQKRGSESQIFNYFLRQGTLPLLATQSIPKEHLFQIFIQSHFNASEQKLLAILAHFNTSIVTTHQLYSYAKERYKISKDLIYRQIKEFKEKKIITFISDYDNSNNKKLIFFDFALAKYLALTQNFPKQFDTMVALSLIKHNVPIKSFYFMGYITDKKYLVIPAPFENEEIVWKKAHKKFSSYKKANIQKVYIITVTLQYSFKIEDIPFEALPFYEWVVINDED